MQFICDHNHKFHYPAKITKGFTKQPPTNPTETFEVAVASVEYSGCPFCETKSFSEIVEPSPTESDLEDMLHVEYGHVQEYLTKGYIELDRKDHVYAKGLVMIKLKAKTVEQPDSDCNEAIIEAAATTQQIAESSFDKTAQEIYDKLDGNKQ